MKLHRSIFFAVLFCVSVFSAFSQVRVGADLLFSRHADLIHGKRIGLVTNHSALLSDGRHLADALAADKEVKLVALFGPEHGIRGDAPDGRTVGNSIDPTTGAPVYSLYGKVNKPTAEMLKDVDVLIFDIQDVGVRFYTFISTLFLTMESAAEKGIPFVVLDRPNPIRGVLVEGPIRVDSLKSFVGWVPMPVSHGMTVGELARMANGEHWLANGVQAKLTVLELEGWKRTMWYDETGLRWIKPSPNMKLLSTAVVYPGTCLIEGTNISEGRGSERPFEWIGAPFMDGERWSAALNAQKLPGVRFSAVHYTPEEIAGVASHPKHQGRICNGIAIEVTDRNAFQPFRTGVHILASAKAIAPDSMQWRGSIDRLAGTTELRLGLNAGKTPEELLRSWESQRRAFESQRKKYLLYH